MTDPTTSAVLPTNAASTVINGLVNQVTANIAPILVLVGFSVGLALVLRWFKKSGRVKA